MVVALLLVFAAFDDITTDNGTSFRVEYAFLGACAAWFAYVAVRLVGRGHRVLGVISLLALAGAVWGQRTIGPGIVPGLWPGYAVTTTAYLWFWALALLMIFRGSGRGARAGPAQSGREGT